MDKIKHVRSPVTGDWVARADVEGAHLFPLCVAQQTMTYIFGPEAEDELNRVSNELFLQGSIEQAFHRHQLTIVPSEEEKKS